MHPNEQLIREGFDAFARADLDAIRATWTDDVEWVTTGHSKLSGTYRGADDIFGMFGRMLQISNGTFTTEIAECCANDRVVMVQATDRATLAGQEIETSSLLVFQMRDGKVCRCTLVEMDQALVDSLVDRAVELAGV